MVHTRAPSIRVLKQVNSLSRLFTHRSDTYRTMPPVGQGYLDPENHAGPNRYSHARVVKAEDNHTIYVSGIAAVNPIDGSYEGVRQRRRHLHC